MPDSQAGSLFRLLKTDAREGLSLGMTPTQFVWIPLKPIAAIGHPPAENPQRNRCSERPPKRQSKISYQAQYGERGPEDLSFHLFILA